MTVREKKLLAVFAAAVLAVVTAFNWHSALLAADEAEKLSETAAMSLAKAVSVRASIEAKKKLLEETASVYAVRTERDILSLGESVKNMFSTAKIDIRSLVFLNESEDPEVEVSFASIPERFASLLTVLKKYLPSLDMKYLAVSVGKDETLACVVRIGYADED